MKHVVSVSIGSSKRDHAVEVTLLGERFRIERRGTDGDLARARELVADLDGKVDAIGLGGMDLYVYAGGRRYTFRDAARIAAAATRTPVVDGSGLKNSLERWVVEYLQQSLGLSLAGQRVLMVSAVDRFGMAEALVRAGCQMVFGDLMFALGVPIPLHGLRTLAYLGAMVLPVITRLPFKLVYPTGSQQEETRPRHERYYRWADLIAGDFHFIRRYMPADLTGKTILTNTVTPADVEELRRRGVSRLITTTPNLNGRSFGTNVIEAALVALSGLRPEALKPETYLDLVRRLDLRPRVEELGPASRTVEGVSPGAPRPAPG